MCRVQVTCQGLCLLVAHQHKDGNGVDLDKMDDPPDGDDNQQPVEPAARQQAVECWPISVGGPPPCSAGEGAV